ncbi:heavy metal translocating P-type ATPase [Acinetobacter shaoyimingii]|uniref:Heavy metal translocating P-type ATPase n=1 Tax=Acinetobacter shaoyimingii TaxID=2715164 RepID=A0A6G8RTX7_9GAMM|nr:heavy metal translocating P-type ATPase [Acinetobacter shaoyimingii]QIO05386.1 heavy metal translocating P-type ATPase [Acinetobacter shaoyimingii]
MSTENHVSCCSGKKTPLEIINIDPVCGMTVSEDSAHFYDLDQKRYLFCCSGCQQKFQQHPEVYLSNIKANVESTDSCCDGKNEQKHPNAHVHGEAVAHDASGSKDSNVVTLTKKSSFGSNQTEKPDELEKAFHAIDPVCGMTVSDPNKPHFAYADQSYYFCGQSCLNKFAQDPEHYLGASQASQVHHHHIDANQTASACCGGHTETASSADTEIDPVCGMSVDTATDLKTDYQGKTYYFCNPSCLSKFEQDPESYMIPFAERKQPEGMDDVLFTCPMDPEIVQKGPGTCPICGMALEPMQPSLDDGPNPELVDFSRRFWTTLPLTLLVFVLAMGSHLHTFISPHIQPWIELVLSLPVVLWAGKPFLERCWFSYKTRNLNMWSLIGVGILAAFVYSVIATVFPSLIPDAAKTGHGVAVYFEAACMIVSLSLLGQIMELKARAKTADSLKALLKLQPNTAKRVEQDQIVEVEISQIHQGDILQISSGEHIPLDGVVVDGQTYVDESMMTGEPLPVKKQLDDIVIGGTINQQGSIRIQTTAVGQNTTLAKMIRVVADAQRSKAPLQKMADVVAKYFVMIVLSISVLTFITWMIFGHAQFDLALMCAVAVLIIACPCALGLATPMSVMATTGRAAQKGVLFKNAEAIESLNAVNTIIVDKTGTLTEGQPSVQNIHVVEPDIDQDQIETWIASLEQYSSHPIAQTLAKIVPSEDYVEVTDFHEFSGFGVGGQIDGFSMFVGSQKLIEQLGIDIEPELEALLDHERESGQVISFLATEQQILAIITVQDAIKAHAKQVIQQLLNSGVDVVMATGDHEKNARHVADKLGIQHVYGNCTPEEKLEIVKKYQAEGKVVAMAGDGINDAPALAQANVGIAMGTGTDIAKQTAQITLVKGDIRGICDAIQMAQQGVKNMKQNLAFSFLYNGLGVPVAAGIFYPFTGWLLTPMIAAIAMSLSSLSVVLNALRLNKS